MGPFWNILAANGAAPKIASFGPKKMMSPKSVPKPFGKVNGAYLGQFGPVLRVKG